MKKIKYKCVHDCEWKSGEECVWERERENEIKNKERVFVWLYVMEEQRERKRSHGDLKSHGARPHNERSAQSNQKWFHDSQTRRQTDKKIDIKDKQAVRLRNGICLTRIVFEI